MAFQFCPHCMAYKRMRWASAYVEQIGSAMVAAVMLAWLVTRPAIHWTSWVLAAIVFPMTIYFGWPRRKRLRCEGCGRAMAVGDQL